MRTRTKKRWLAFVLVLAVAAVSVLPALRLVRADVFDEVISSSSSDGNYIKDNAFDSATDKLSLGKTVMKAQDIVEVIAAICVCIALGFFIWSITKIATSGGNDKKLSEAKTSLLWSGVALAMFGSLLFCVRFFWNFL